ncbi:M28 family peptidase [Fodinibius sediminis]|uniref:Peptidase family M28 n=1 Tax=Fodinibius sediminis TaxID=1214077 RepID=A0A521DAB5_9BACT|nr:M28 family peptidase [Fodinibius sediminis]SMO68542.1 Peptidase family M28 [Fodinibius sediminis]
MNKSVFSIVFLAACFLFFGCTSEDQQRLNFEKKGRTVPAFSADSAYQYIADQLSFGPRNPGSQGHRETKSYLMEKLESYAGTGNAYSQQFTAEGYGGDSLQLTNIIAAFSPGRADRIMLCAHWDTRPRADRDSVKADQPIPGADDGGSGVGVLLELARIFKENPPPIGVDLIFFDGEDYGREGDTNRYFLGSRYWSQHPPVPGYAPRFSILLDMVGGRQALFPKEQYSMQYAPALVNELWSIAEQEGYGHLFPEQEGNAISDDHVVINRILGIPTIDIIHHKPNRGGMGFAPYWHTHNDNMDIIDKNTLKAVGEILTELIYNRM